MKDHERLEKFAAFLDLLMRRLPELAVARKLVSPKTLDRLRANGAGQRHARSLAKVADLIDPNYLAAPHPADPFAHSKLAARVRELT